MITAYYEYIPGLLGRITELHATYYHRRCGFDLFFEAKVAEELSDFLRRFDPAKDGLWIAVEDEHVVGAVAISGKDADKLGARLRWLIVAPHYQGRGLGKKLMRAAMDFCRSAGFKRIYLTTIAGLEASRHLYDQEGFRVISEKMGVYWGKSTQEHTLELLL